MAAAVASVVTVPERLDAAGIRTLEAQLASAIASHPHAVLLEGAAAERFCVGLDFGSIDRTSPRGGLETFARVLRLLRCSPRPTVAVVDGPALAGGLGIAAACDVVVATERATAGLPEALYGLAPALIRPALLTRLSPQKLRLLLFTCHSRSAEEARALGLFDVVVPVAGLERARSEIVRNLRRAKTESVIAVRRWDEAELERQLSAGITETNAALSDPRVAATIAAFKSEEELPWQP